MASTGLVRIKMNTAAAFQLRDTKGNPAGFSSVARGDETELSQAEADNFVKAGYATVVDAKSRS